MTTKNLADFGYSERNEMIALLQSWHEQGLPDGFYEDEVTVMMNKTSGLVFLTNSEHQVSMMNGDKLEMWHNCFSCGHEGFEEDCQLNDDGCNECRKEKQ